MADTEYFWLWTAIAIIAGYLLGAFSFARIITVLKTKSKEVKSIKREVPQYEIEFESDSISATSVGLNLGKKYGCLSSVLDMAKVALPALALNYIFPDRPYYLVFAIMGVTGHIYPLYYGFKGGRGISTIIGGMLVVNWFGILISNLASFILGFLTGSVLVVRWGWLVALIPWLALYFNDLYITGYIVLANLLFWTSMIPELKKYKEIRSNTKPSQEEISDFMFMGKSFGRFFDNYSLPALIWKLFKSK